MNDAGRIGFVIRGDYDDTDTYDFLDVVYYNGASYVAKKLTVGHAPQRNDEYWQIFAEGNIVSSVNGKVGNVELTAKSVGALPVTGGEMQGNISFESLEGDYKIINPETIKMKYEGIINANAGYINDVENMTFSDKTHPVKDSAILTTSEQISANTSADNVAGALALKAAMTDYNTKINQINSNLANKSSYVSYGTGTGFTQKVINIPNGLGGLYLINVWNNYVGKANTYLLSNANGYFFLYDLIINATEINVSFDTDTNQLTIKRGIGDYWGYSVLRLSLYTDNGSIDVN